jgi:hypothetical protein
MKSILVTVLFSFLAFPVMGNTTLPGLFPPEDAFQITCDPDLPIVSHMRTMSRLISDMNSFVDELLNLHNSDVRAALMSRSQRLRVHLSAVMHKVPDKIYQIDPSSVQRAQLIFQDYLVRVMQKTIEIELELMRNPSEPWQQQAQRVRLANLVFELESIVNAAHTQFR